MGYCTFRTDSCDTFDTCQRVPVDFLQTVVAGPQRVLLPYYYITPRVGTLTGWRAEGDNKFPPPPSFAEAVDDE